ncbi:MAG TPA: YceI family protein [Anaerolineaceae bacterium]
MSWKIDSAHSQITFSVRHMMISNVHGRFESFTGTVDFNEADPTKSSVDVKIDTAAINTREAKRDDHLRSPDFFEAEKYPNITFISKRIEKVDNNHGRIYGDLTIRDLTHEVVLDTEYSGQSTIWGKTSAGFSASTRINRKNWNLNWNKDVESGGLLVGDDININIELELIKDPEVVAESDAA